MSTRRRRRPRRRLILNLDARTARDVRRLARRYGIPPEAVARAAVELLVEAERRT